MGCLVSPAGGLFSRSCSPARKSRAAEEFRRPIANPSFSPRCFASMRAQPFGAGVGSAIVYADGLAARTISPADSPDASVRVATAPAISSPGVAFNELIRFSRPAVRAARQGGVVLLKPIAPYGHRGPPKAGACPALSDLEVKRCGVADRIFRIRLWPALARQNGIKITIVKHD